jgi:uncharacterized protein (DUF2062 family)
MANLNDIGGPFLVGCLILGIISSVVGYFGIRSFWRWNVVKHWNARPHK